MKPSARALALMLALIFCAAIFASCIEQKKKYNIEIIVAGTETEFWRNAYAGAEAAAEEYNVNVKLFGPQFEADYYRQENILRQSIERKPDMIVLAAADCSVTVELVDLAAKNGIPILAVDSHTGGSKLIAYVGSDNYELGRTLAREIKSRYNNKGGAVAVVSYIKGSMAAKEREDGFLEELSGSPDFRLLETVYCDSDAETAKSLVFKLMSDNDDITAIACLNAQSTIGACKAIEEKGYQGIVLAGVDCAAEEAELLERGILDVALLQNSFAMGYLGVETAVKKLRGETPDTTIYTEFCVITKENMFFEENQRLIFPLS